MSIQRRSSACSQYPLCLVESAREVAHRVRQPGLGCLGEPLHRLVTLLPVVVNHSKLEHGERVPLQ